MPKPTSKPLWTNGNAPARTEPSGGKKTSGWLGGERPSFRFMNWLFFNVGEWIDWFESVTDSFIGYQSIYSAFVGTGGLATHSTITAASAAAPAGARILVLENYTVNSAQVLSKNRQQLEFMPGAIYTKGSAQYGIQVQADYCKIIGGEFEGFSGGSDAAIRVDAAADFANIRGPHFRNCTTGVDDANGTASVAAITEET